MPYESDRGTEIRYSRAWGGFIGLGQRLQLHTRLSQPTRQHIKHAQQVRAGIGAQTATRCCQAKQANTDTNSNCLFAVRAQIVTAYLLCLWTTNWFKLFGKNQTCYMPYKAIVRVEAEHREKDPALIKHNYTHFKGL